MLKFSVIVSVISILLLTSCSSGTNPIAKKLHLIEQKEFISRLGFDPTAKGFRCDSLNIKAVIVASKIKQIIVLLGKSVLDTVNFKMGKIPGNAEKDVIVSDYNFDGFCEFVVPDKKSETAGGMNYYYFIYDTLNRNFIENTSLPKFIGNFKLDVKNQRVKIYCPDEACFGYYKFENNVFKLVQGEYK